MQDFEKIFAQLLKIITQYFKENEDPETLVLNYQKATELEKILNLAISSEGCRPEDIFEEMKSFLKYSVRTGHKNFLNQLYTGPHWPAVAGEILASLSNTSMSTYEVSPVGTLVELALIKKMNSLVGFHQGEGIFVTGGSNANLVAMLCARNTLFPQVKELGLWGQKKPLIFVSEDAHYSYSKAANCLGIGTNQVVLVPTDSFGRMIPAQLEAKIEEALQSEAVPFFIGATSMTTVTGAFDPLPEIHQIAKKHNLWLHVDGAYGGALLLSPTHRNLLQGCELADSFAWDAHKIMGVPLICSVLLLREKGTLFKCQGGGGGEYLFHEYENDAYDLGTLSLQCGRRMDSLKLWLNWKFVGDRGQERRIQKLETLAQFAENWVLGHSRLKLITPRQSLNVCFQYHHPDVVDVNGLNLKIRQRLVTEGKYMINYSWWKDKLIFRAVFLNPEFTTDDITSLFETIVKIGDEFVLAV